MTLFPALEIVDAAAPRSGALENAQDRSLIVAATMSRSHLTGVSKAHTGHLNGNLILIAGNDLRRQCATARQQKHGDDVSHGASPSFIRGKLRPARYSFERFPFQRSAVMPGQLPARARRRRKADSVRPLMS